MPDCTFVTLDHFQELFLENNSKRPVIVLSGVKVSDLRAIMQFIYTGEVNVTEVDLPDLLEVAEMLGVRGLKSGADKENEEEAEPTKEEQPEEPPVQITPVKESENSTEEISPSISITKVTPTKSETKNPVSSDSFQISVKKDLTASLIASDEDNITEHEAHPQSILPDDNIVAEEADEDTNDTAQTDNSFSQPQVPLSAFPAFSSSSYMRPLMNSPVSPLVSMSNLAAMYQHQLTSPTKQFTSPVKQDAGAFEGKTLEWYRASSQEGKIALDLLPEDINSIMSQSTTPFCPICNKDCANFPNLRSHLQVLSLSNI